MAPQVDSSTIDTGSAILGQTLEAVGLDSEWDRYGVSSNLGMSALGRFLPVAILSPDRLVIGESGHSKMI